MRNPKTTMAGYAVLLSAILSMVAKLLKGLPLGVEDFTMLSVALAGVGLIAGADGGH